MEFLPSAHKGIEIFKQEVCGITYHFIGRKRADSTKFDTNLTVHAVYVAQQ